MFIYRAHNHHNFNNFLCHTSDKQLQGSRQEQLIIEELIIKHEGVISQTHSVQAVGQFEMMTTDQYNCATVSQRSTNNRELKHKTFCEPQMATGSQMFPFLVWFCSSQQKGKALVGRLWLDVTNTMVSKCSKKEKFNCRLVVRGSRMSVLISSLMCILIPDFD